MCRCYLKDFTIVLIQHFIGTKCYVIIINIRRSQDHLATPEDRKSSLAMSPILIASWRSYTLKTNLRGLFSVFNPRFMRSSEVTKTESSKTEPQKMRFYKSLIDSPHPNKLLFKLKQKLAFFNFNSTYISEMIFSRKLVLFYFRKLIWD